jgi:hypothetical protein
MTRFCGAVTWVPPPTGNHLTGFLLKKGHGGTTRTNTSAVPPRAIKRASLISWRKYPTINAMV